MIESIDLLRFILFSEVPAKLVSNGDKISSCATSFKLVRENKTTKKIKRISKN